jgi:hypothetical protein
MKLEGLMSVRRSACNCRLEPSLVRRIPPPSYPYTPLSFAPTRDRRRGLQRINQHIMGLVRSAAYPIANTTRYSRGRGRKGRGAAHRDCTNRDRSGCRHLTQHVSSTSMPVIPYNLRFCQGWRRAAFRKHSKAVWAATPALAIAISS